METRKACWGNNHQLYYGVIQINAHSGLYPSCYRVLTDENLCGLVVKLTESLSVYLDEMGTVYSNGNLIGLWEKGNRCTYINLKENV